MCHYIYTTPDSLNQRTYPVYSFVNFIVDFRLSFEVHEKNIREEVHHMIQIFSGSLYAWYNCTKFHLFGICVTSFRNWGPFCSPHLLAAPKRPILNRIKLSNSNMFFQDILQKCMSYQKVKFFCQHYTHNRIIESVNPIQCMINFSA